MDSTKWDVNVNGKDSILITIDDNIDISNLSLTLINELRQPILKMEVDNREILLTTNIESPIFVQIGDSVKYVKGSGGNSYINFKNN